MGATNGVDSTHFCMTEILHTNNQRRCVIRQEHDDLRMLKHSDRLILIVICHILNVNDITCVAKEGGTPPILLHHNPLSMVFLTPKQGFHLRKIILQLFAII